jgi:hypothetical protein
VVTMSMAWKFRRLSTAFAVATGRYAAAPTTATTHPAAAATASPDNATSANLPSLPTRRSSPAVSGTIRITALVPASPMPAVTRKAVSFAVKELNLVDAAQTIDRRVHAQWMADRHGVCLVGRWPRNHHSRDSR